MHIMRNNNSRASTFGTLYCPRCAKSPNCSVTLNRNVSGYDRLRIDERYQEPGPRSSSAEGGRERRGTDSDPLPDEFYNYSVTARRPRRPRRPLSAGMELCFHETIFACLCRRGDGADGGRQAAGEAAIHI